MANLVPSGVDLTTGQIRPLSASDVLADTAGNPLVKNSVRVLSSPTVALSSAGNTTLYIVPANKTVFITEIILAVNTATNIDTPATVSVGVNTSSDVVAPIALTALTQTGSYYSLDVSDNTEIATALSNITLSVTSAATGAGSPSQTATAYLLGIQV